jgi:hypothetical protein
LLAAIFLFVDGTEVRADQDCSKWHRQGDGLEHFEIKLGFLISAVPSAIKSNTLSGPRYFDGLNVNTYVSKEKGALIETVPCSDGTEFIVGIRTGELIPGKKSTDRWIAEQEVELRQSGIQHVHREWQGAHLYLWGVRSTIGDPSSTDVFDHLVLRRGCMRTSSTASSICDMTRWDVHKVRSKRGVESKS